MTRLADIYGPGHTQADYQRALAAGYETGYWDEHGIPAPWPENQTEWPQPPNTTIDPAPLNPGQPPF
jgi:hypothetical protein